jgi:hypothetical protein
VREYLLPENNRTNTTWSIKPRAATENIRFGFVDMTIEGAFKELEGW